MWFLKEEKKGDVNMTFAIIVKSIAIFFSMVWLLVTFTIALKNFMKGSIKDDWALALFAFTPCMLNQFLLEICQTFPVKDCRTFAISALVFVNLGLAVAIIWDLICSRRRKNN